MHACYGVAHFYEIFFAEPRAERLRKKKSAGVLKANEKGRCNEGLQQIVLSMRCALGMLCLSSL